MVDANESQPIRELSPGKILLQGRLQSGLTQEQVAKELYMTVGKVKALEADDYSRLSSDTFARGYIRAYANLVKIDVVSVLVAYDALMDAVKPSAVESNAPVSTTENSHRGTWQFLLLIGAFLVGLWLISVWFFDNHSESEYLVPAPVVSLSSVGSEDLKKSFAVSSSVASEMNFAGGAVSALVNGSAGAELKSATFVGVSSSSKSADVITSPSTQNASVVTSSSIAAAQVSTSSNVKKTTLDEISFSFRGECWLEVSDSRGDVLATELEPAGGKITLLGRAPFDVKLGNAPAVDIQLNGKKIDVVPLIGSNVLTLKVGN